MQFLQSISTFNESMGGGEPRWKRKKRSLAAARKMIPYKTAQQSAANLDREYRATR